MNKLTKRVVATLLIILSIPTGFFGVIDQYSNPHYEDRLVRAQVMNKVTQDRKHKSNVTGQEYYLLLKSDESPKVFALHVDMVTYAQCEITDFLTFNISDADMGYHTPIWKTMLYLVCVILGFAMLIYGIFLMPENNRL